MKKPPKSSKSKAKEVKKVETPQTPPVIDYASLQKTITEIAFLEPNKVNLDKYDLHEDEDFENQAVWMQHGFKTKSKVI